MSYVHPADEPDPPDAPVYMSAEAAYGWGCGWSAGYRSAHSDIERLRSEAEALRSFIAVNQAAGNIPRDAKILGAH